MSAEDLRLFYTRKYGPFVHMAPLDTAIFLRFLHRGGTQYAPFIYDMRVGDGLQMPSGSSDMEHNIAYALTTKRIDAVSRANGRVLIIEVKQRAGLGAIGQLIGYKHLYEQDNGTDQPVDMMLITDKLQSDLTGPMTANKINYIEVGYE